MASITIHNLEEGLKRRLDTRAAEHGCSMEEEARNILRKALAQGPAPVKHLGTAIHQLFKPLGGIELSLPQREPMRDPPRFD